MKFRPDIEGIRALAVVAVIVFHAWPTALPGGFVGVDVFFVVSGYLITGLLLAEAQRHGRIDLWQFYARRARRLLPAAAVVTLATLCVSAFVYAPFEQARFLRSAVATFAYASNIRFLLFSTDYFAPETAADPFLHTWSLSVEEQFYLAWPLLILVAVRSRLSVPRLLWIIAGASFAVSLAMTELRPQWAFFLMPARAWEFAIGGLAAVMPVHALERRHASVIGLAGVTGIVLACVGFSERTPFPGVAALVPTLATVFLLRLASHRPESVAVRWLALAPCQYLGRLSYSLYLWHWPVLTVGAAAFPAADWTARVALVAVTVALADISLRVVENPIRFSPLVAARPRIAITGAIAIAALGVTASVFAARSLDRVTDPAQVQFRTIASTRPAMDTRRCVASFTERRPLECTFGDPGATRTLVLFGDSHASQWFPAIEAFAATDGWKVITLVKSSCTPADVRTTNTRLRRAYTECDEWRDAAVRRIRDLRPAVVLVSSFTSAYADLLTEPSAHPFATLSTGLRQTLLDIQSPVTRAILVHDSPSLGFDSPSCLSRATYHGRRTDTSCSVPRDAAVDARAVAAERAAVAGLTVATLDLTDRFCDQSTCAAMRNGHVLYRDSNHVAVSFAVSLADDLRRALASVSDT